MVVLWRFFFANWKASKMTLNMDLQAERHIAIAKNDNSTVSILSIMQVKVTKSKISFKHINNGAYVYLVLSSIVYAPLFYTGISGIVVVGKIKIWLAIYLVS
jgi:hypothetical protein